MPAIRIGAQPYGILPATALSRMAWLNQRSTMTESASRCSAEVAKRCWPISAQLYPILLAIDQDWRAKLADVSFVGKAGDPHALLLDIVGLHPARSNGRSATRRACRRSTTG